MTVTHLHDEHVFSFPFKEHASLSLIDTKVFLLCTYAFGAIEDNEDICIGARSKHITRESFYLIWDNWDFKNKKVVETSVHAGHRISIQIQSFILEI